MAAGAGHYGAPAYSQKRMRIRPGRRNHHISFTSKPEDHCRNEHQYSRNTESDGGSEFPQKNRHEPRSEERTEVDDPIKSVEHHFGAMLVRLVELVAHERGH